LERVIVTGGAGFIGSHIVDRLILNGFEVAVLDNMLSGFKSNINQKATFYEIDLYSDDLDVVIEEFKPSLVYHLAAQSSVSVSESNPNKDANINILGSLNLYKACNNSTVKRIILSSTGGAIYGNQKILPCSEQNELNPISPYGVSKLASEKYLEVFSELYGYEYTILRYGNVYGPRQNPSGEAGVISIFAGLLLNGETAKIFGDGSQERDYIYISDVVDANILALNSTNKSIYNISTGQGLSVIEIFNQIKKITKSSNNPIFMPSRKSDVNKIILDNTKAINELKWKPKITIENGISNTINYLLETL
jgi:UDP-glucose 4-epimerase